MTNTTQCSAWLTLADALRTASVDYDEYKVKYIKELLSVPLTQ